jgi:catechol 2,3-dioxygenase-like lactoylglutathione lyase family enzyme
VPEFRSVAGVISPGVGQLKDSGAFDSDDMSEYRKVTELWRQVVLNMIRGIHHIALHTANFDAQVDFYREAFGFIPVIDENRWQETALVDRAIGVPGSAARTIMLKAGNCYLELFEYFSPEVGNVAPLRPFDLGYTHFCVDVTDIEVEYKRLAALGMTFANPEPIDFGILKTVYGKDPDGHLIEVQELPSDYPATLDKLDAVTFDGKKSA